MDPEATKLEPHARRMTAVSTLARPVQHEINNLLTVVFANLELLKRTAAEGGPQRQLDRIHEAARRMDGSTRALLTLLRRPTGLADRVRLSDALASLQPLLVLLLPGASGLTIELAPQDPAVLLQRAALEDALLTIAQQASERMPRGTGLAMTLTHADGTVRLTVTMPEGLELPALAALAALAEAAGGCAETGPGRLSIGLPALPTAG